MKKIVWMFLLAGWLTGAYAEEVKSPELTDDEAQQLELETIPMVQKMVAMGGTAYMMGDIPYGSHEEQQLLQLATLSLSMELTSPSTKAYAYGIVATYYRCSKPEQTKEAKSQIYKTVMHDNSVKMSERKSVITAYYKLINQRSCDKIKTVKPVSQKKKP